MKIILILFFISSCSLLAELELWMRVWSTGIEKSKNAFSCQFFFFSEDENRNLAVKVKDQSLLLTNDGKTLVVCMHITNHKIHINGKLIPVLTPLHEIGYINLKSGHSVQLGNVEKIDFDKYPNIESIEVSYYMYSGHKLNLGREITYSKSIERDKDGIININGATFGTFQMKQIKFKKIPEKDSETKQE